MNKRQSFYDVSSFYNKKAVLKCSFKGMRYQVAGISKDDDVKVLQADVWPEPFCYEKTPLEFHTYHYEELNEIAVTIKQMQDEINHYIKKLKSEKKIRQEFFDNASHELKTPLTSIRGYGELLRSGVVDDPQQAKECVDRILKETNHMTALIADILMISRLEGNDVVEEKIAIPLRSTVDEICKSLTCMAQEAHVTLDVQCEDCTVMMSQKHLDQLLSNLITNAIKYNRENGPVVVFV